MPAGGGQRVEAEAGKRLAAPVTPLKRSRLAQVVAHLLLLLLGAVNLTSSRPLFPGQAHAATARTTPSWDGVPK